LDGGADPRIIAEDGANPEQVTNTMHTSMQHILTSSAIYIVETNQLNKDLQKAAVFSTTFGS